MKSASLKLVLPVMAFIAGCSSPNNSGNTDVACRPIVATVATRPVSWRGSVFTIVMENRSRGEILGSGDAPYINKLAQDNAVAAGYHDSFVHPSEPNYIWMTSGENYGILNDNDPGRGNVIDSQSHIADQIERAGLTWKTYQESMGAPCGLTSHDRYAVKHNPFAYYADINGFNGATFSPPPRCAEHIVDYSQFDVDVNAGTLPDYVFITPNLDNDMHDGSVAQGDAWLSREVPKILGSKAYQQGGVLFILWDEGSNSGDDPPFLAVSPNAKHGFVSAVSYDTSSYLKTVQHLLGVEELPCSANPAGVSVMSDLFASPM